MKKLIISFRLLKSQNHNSQFLNFRDFNQNITITSLWFSYWWSAVEISGGCCKEIFGSGFFRRCIVWIQKRSKY